MARTGKTITLHKGDIPDGLNFGKEIAVDTETMGLRFGRDRLCLVQLSSGDGTAHLVQFEVGPPPFKAPNLVALLNDPDVIKIFHFARFDMAVLMSWLGALPVPAFCTKIASRLVRTYTDRHGLRDLCQDLLGIELSKQQQSSDWGAPELTQQQLRYAANDVLHLHRIRAMLDERLEREDRSALAYASFDFLPVRAQLDMFGFRNDDIFSH